MQIGMGRKIDQENKNTTKKFSAKYNIIPLGLGIRTTFGPNWDK